MRLTFGYPSAGDRTGGVMALYEIANALSRRGHEVRFLHGPKVPLRIGALDQLPPECFGHGVEHFLVDEIDDPSVPDGDVVFLFDTTARYGLPVSVVQGYGLVYPEWEQAAFLARAPKVCVAKWLIDIGVGLGVPRDQFIHAPCGIDHEVFKVRTALDERTVDVVGLSHPHPEKGFPDMVAALHRVAEQRPETTGLIFGRDVPPQPMPPGFTFVHSPEHDQLAKELYGRCRVFVQASLREGFGLTPVEAMACGAALVTTDNGGSQDYAVEGETALITPPGDPAQLADSIVRLLNDDAERQRLAANGVAYAQRFRWDSSAIAIDELLRAYVQNPSAYQAPPSP